MRLLGRLFWAAIAVIVVIAVYKAFTLDEKREPHVDTVNLEDYSPRCVNARGEAVEFQPRQHKVFEEENLSGLAASQDEETILYDYDELSKEPPEYRDFVLLAACARNSGMSAAEAECTAVKRLRDEKSLRKEKVTLIMKRLSSGSGESDRAQALLACFGAHRN